MRIVAFWAVSPWNNDVFDSHMGYGRWGRWWRWVPLTPSRPANALAHRLMRVHVLETAYSVTGVDSGGASSENSPGPGKVAKIFARSF